MASARRAGVPTPGCPGSSVTPLRTCVVFRRRFRIPLVLAFALVAFFIWLAENIATFSHAWTYPDQVDAWHPVSPEKLVSWFLLMIISVVLVTWVYPPRLPDSESVAEPKPQTE